MPLLLLLPLTTGITFIVTVLLVLSKSKNKDKKYIALYCFMFGTTLAISLIEAIVIHHYHGFDDKIILDKLVIFIIAIVVNVLATLSKGLLVLKTLKKDTPDYAEVTTKIKLLDPLCLGVLILIVLGFRIK